MSSLIKYLRLANLKSMNLPLTYAVLATLTGALVLLRFLWPRLPRPIQILLLVCAFLVPILFGLAVVTRWSTSSFRLNASCYWACIASYELLLILFTRLRPRWLTSIIAIILILPILSASVFLPLAGVFDVSPVTTAVLGHGILSERVPWGTGTFEATGTDLFIYSKPSWVPFLRRRRQASRYYNSQCNASQAFAVLQPGSEAVLMVCPASPGQPPSTARSLVVKLY